MPLRSLLLALGLLAPAPAAAQEPLNVLWLTVEDMSPWIACYGDDTVPTPNLDRLAADSVRYTNAFASSPVCAPARSTLITGVFATRMGTMHMRTGHPSESAIAANPDAYADIPSYQGVPPEYARCFPELLRAAGYFCTNAAKRDYQFEAPATVWDASRGKAHWRDRGPEQPFFAVFNHGGTHESQVFPEARRRPVAVLPKDVTVPPLYPDTPAVREALSRTYDNIAAMDVWVGERLTELEEAGLADSTVVFFFSDHGVGLPRGKRSPYDLGTRVPLLVRFPDGAGAGTTDARVVTFADFGPSVLSLCALEPDARLDGVPFLGPHAREGSGYAFTHADRFDAVYDRARSVSDGRFRYVRNDDTSLPHLIDNAYRNRLAIMADLLALRGEEEAPPGTWQVASTSRPAEELYDSSTDPWEVVNLAGDPDHAETLQRLRAALDGWIESTGDLGFVLPERRMVSEHLWPDLEQPATAAPSLHRVGGRVELRSATAGASLGYRFVAEEPWTVYTGPFTLPGGLAEGAQIELLAHRIGYAPVVVQAEL